MIHVTPAGRLPGERVAEHGFDFGAALGRHQIDPGFADQLLGVQIRRQFIAAEGDVADNAVHAAIEHQGNVGCRCD